MKKYTKPTIEIVEFEAKQNMADVNPINATSYDDEGTITTVYNLAIMGGTSIPTGTTGA